MFKSFLNLNLVSKIAKPERVKGLDSQQFAQRMLNSPTLASAVHLNRQQRVNVNDKVALKSALGKLAVELIFSMDEDQDEQTYRLMLQLLGITMDIVYDGKLNETMPETQDR